MKEHKLWLAPQKAAGNLEVERYCFRRERKSGFGNG